jgi:hypothetical protein
MNSLAELQRRKAELKTQIEQQSDDLKKTVSEIRSEIEPAKLLRKAIGGAFGVSKSEQDETRPDILNQLPAPLTFLAGLLIKDPKLALLVKLIVPVALKYWPRRIKTKTPAEEEEPAEKASRPHAKNKLYGRLRRGVSALRSHLRRTTKELEKPIEKPLEKEAEQINK